MNAIVANMRALAANMCVLTASVRDDTRKIEETDLETRIAAWKKREKEKAKRAIAQLPAVIKSIAEKGKGQLIVRVEVTQPYVGSDIDDTYKVLRSWNFPSLLWFETPNPRAPLSLHKIVSLRDGARMIARWALREGFIVHFHKWDERGEIENLRRYDIFDIDQVVAPVFVDSQHGGYHVLEGFSLAW